MIYRITLSSNPRILLIVGAIILLPVVGVSTYFFLPLLISIVVMGGAAYFDYHMTKYLYATLKSRVETTDTGLLFSPDHRDVKEMQWESITHAGHCVQEKGRPCLFVYNEEEDQLLTIPNEYEGFDQLAEELRSRISLEEVTLESNQTVDGYLRNKVGTADAETDP